jgi:dihydroneopterin aldolase
MITIELNDLEFYAYHGVYEEEKEKGNTFHVNLSVTGTFDQAIIDDNLDGTIDYEELFALVQQEMEVPSNLLEHVVGRIRTAIKEAIPGNKIDRYQS